MSYRTEFPDFEIPAILLDPRSWEDTSWRNDTCPSFTCDVFVLWVDYADEAKRETRGGPQFIMVCEGDVYLETDDWEDVRAFIEDGKRDFPDYVRREVPDDGPYAPEEDAALKEAWDKAEPRAARSDEATGDVMRRVGDQLQAAFPFGYRSEDIEP